MNLEEVLSYALQYQVEIFLDIGIGFVRAKKGFTGEEMTVYFEEIPKIKDALEFCVSSCFGPSPFSAEKFEKKDGAFEVYWPKES